MSVGYYKIWNFENVLWRLSYANVSVSHCICWIYLLPHPFLETISIRFRTLLNHSIVRHRLYLECIPRKKFFEKCMLRGFTLLIAFGESSFMIHHWWIRQMNLFRYVMLSSLEHSKTSLWSLRFANFFPRKMT